MLKGVLAFIYTFRYIEIYHPSWSKENIKMQKKAITN